MENCIWCNNDCKLNCKSKTNKMQTLTRKQLVDLYNQFECNDFRKVIEEILKSNPISLDYTLFPIGDKYMELFIQKGTPEQKKAVMKLGVVLIGDKSVDVTDFIARKFIAVRNSDEYQNKAFYLNPIYDWEIKKDAYGILCLTPTKK